MAKQSNAPVVISITGLSGRAHAEIRISPRKKPAAVRRTPPRSDTSVPAKIAKGAAIAAALAVLGVAAAPAVKKKIKPKKKDALDTYTELVGKFAEARKQYKSAQQAKTATAVRQGYSPKTGLYTMQKMPKLPAIRAYKKGKRLKPYKAPRIKRSTW